MASAASDDEQHGIVCHLDVLLEQRQMTLKELSARVGVTVVNLSVLKNDRARAVRFSTLSALCEALHCQPGELFSYRPVAGPEEGATTDTSGEVDDGPNGPA